MREILRIAKIVEKFNEGASNLYVTSIICDEAHKLQSARIELINEKELSSSDDFIVMTKLGEDSFKVQFSNFLEIIAGRDTLYYTTLKNQIDSLKKRFFRLELAVDYGIIKEIDFKNELLSSIEKKVEEELQERELKTRPVCKISVSKTSWLDINPSLAKYILDVLNDSEGRKNAYSYDLDTQRFLKDKAVVSDKFVLDLLLEEKSLLSALNVSYKSGCDLDLYKAVNEEAVSVISDNMDNMLGEEDIAGVNFVSLRDAGLSFDDLDYLRRLGLVNLNDITYAQAKELSVYKFAFSAKEQNRESFVELFKSYKDMEDRNEAFEDSAIIQLEFGCIDFELNVFREEDNNSSFEYFMCAKVKDKDGFGSWESQEYTGIEENLDDLLKVESLESFEEALFNLTMYFSKQKDYTWYQVIE